MSIRPLPKVLQEKAEKDLNEVPGRIKEDLQHLKEWIKKQPHLKARTDGQWLLLFLRSCKFSLQMTKEKLDLFYTVRSAVPEYFTNRDPFLPEIQEYITSGMAIPLPKTSNIAAPRVILSILKNINTNIVNPIVASKAGAMSAEVFLMDDDSYSVAGIQFILDMKNVPLKYVLGFTPAELKREAASFKESYPIRLQGIHVLNLQPLHEAVINFIITLLPEKIKKRVRIYSEQNLSDLYKIIPPSCLPKEYGGDAGPLENLIVDFKAKIEGYRDWFLEDAQYGTDESKRVGNSKTLTELLGMEGSFRKLDID